VIIHSKKFGSIILILPNASKRTFGAFFQILCKSIYFFQNQKNTIKKSPRACTYAIFVVPLQEEK
jgi:hypothetical protein